MLSIRPPSLVFTLRNKYLTFGMAFSYVCMCVYACVCVCVCVCMVLSYVCLFVCVCFWFFFKRVSADVCVCVLCVVLCGWVWVGGGGCVGSVFDIGYTRIPSGLRQKPGCSVS